MIVDFVLVPGLLNKHIQLEQFLGAAGIEELGRAYIQMKDFLYQGHMLDFRSSFSDQ